MEDSGGDLVRPKWEYLLLYIIPIGTIWGNIFVCLAVYLERRLRHRFNLFLVSLAISDLLCALLVMPVSAWQMIIDKPTDRTLCLVWYSLDIFFTATTIIHLCTISLDRYLALRQPFGQVHSRRRLAISLALRITMSWLIPFCIAGPLFMFALWQREKEWKRIQQQLMSIRQQNTSTTLPPSASASYDDDEIPLPASYKGCGPNDQTFVLTAIGVTFVLPLVIITATYLLTVKTLRHHITQVKAIKLYSTPSRRIIPGSQSLTSAKQGKFSYLTRSRSARIPGQSSGDEANRTEQQDTEKQLTDNNTSSAKCSRKTNVAGRLTKHSCHGKCLPSVLIDECNTGSGYNENDDSHDTMEHEKADAAYGPSTKRETSKTLTAGTTIEKLLQRTGQNIAKVTLIAGDAISKSKEAVEPEGRYNRCSKAHGATSSWNMDRIHRSKRAVRVIGGLFGLFVACYLPFFIVYIIDVVCLHCKSWTGRVIPHLEWLGYLSSMLNPVVYHSFNATFRRTFRRMLLTCACRSRHEHQAVWRRTAEA